MSESQDDTSPTMRCLWVEKPDENSPATYGLTNRPLAELPPEDVVVDVHYSSLNYKDALACQGHPGVVRKFPHVPGIDLAGKVRTSSDGRFNPGDPVLATGFELGSGHWGGLAEVCSLPADWLVRLPSDASLEEAMIYGTAGFTAAQGVAALIEHGIEPGSGPIIVTGASGGVGSLGVAILAHLGYEVAAVTGKAEAATFLTHLGAAHILERGEVNDESNRPLLKSRWAGAIDTVGGNTLTTIVRSAQLNACITCCGLVGGTDLPLTVHPFILRGVSLVGLDSAHCLLPRREELWSRMFGEWKPPVLADLAETISLEEVPAKIETILQGKNQGHTVVRIR